MPKISVTVDVEKIAGKIEKYRQEKEKQLRTLIASTALALESQAKVNITEAPAVDTGALRASIHAVFPSINKGLRSTIGPIGEATKKYASYVEFGTGPLAGHGPYRGPPPVSALVDWVRRHRKTKRNPKGFAIRGKTKAEREPDIKSIAYVVARKIGRTGTKPRPFLFNAWEQLRPGFTDAVRKIFSGTQTI